MRIGNQIWMTENLRYAPPGYSMDGAFTWQETSVRREDVQIEAAQIAAIVRAIAPDPQYKGWPDTLDNGLVLQYDVIYLDYADQLLSESNPWSIADLEEALSYSPDFNAVYKERLRNYLQLPEGKAQVGKAHHLAAEKENGGFVAKYGFLYSYEAAMQAAPEGWRLPSDEDWRQLERTLGLADAEVQQTNAWSGNGLSALLAAGGASGFNATPAGCNYFSTEGGHTYFNRDKAWYYWSSTSHTEADSSRVAMIRQSAPFNDKVWRGTARLTTSYRPVLYSVRLVRDVQ